jgi:predicted transcriptional regulator
MTASAYAEAGEFGAAREILNAGDKILLALTGDTSDSSSFKYALNMSKRIHASLEILYISEYKKDVLNHFRSELKKEGIDYSIIKGKKCIKEEILHLTDRKREILFVVVESSERLNINCKKGEKNIAGSWKELKCPIVVVSEYGYGLNK